jgi:predicted enzyme related to lactoylglutathione lyase
MPTIDSYAQGTPCYVELMTPDPGAAKAFYGSLFGWTLTDVPVGEGQDVYVTATLQGDVVAGIAQQMPELAGHPAFWSVYLAVDDVDATTAAVATAGGEVEAGPFDVMDLGRMSAIKDPTGARVNLWEAKSHPGTQRANEPGAPTWNELVSPDVKTATGFYAELLGVTWEDAPMPEGSALESYAMLQVGGRAVAGALPPPMEGLPPHWNVYFNVTDVDQAVTRAESLGGRTTVPAFDLPEVGRMAMLSDPQGAMFWLMGASPEVA